MGGAVAFGLAAVLVGAALLAHYEVLRFTLLLAPRPGWPVRARMLCAMGALLLAHGGVIAVYGTAEWAADGRLGGFAGARLPTSFADHLYVSATAYTCVGFGDAYPVGPMRALVAVESLNGMVLIGWSATFAYLLMQRLWLENPALHERVLAQAPLQGALLRAPGAARPSSPVPGSARPERMPLT